MASEQGEEPWWTRTRDQQKQDIENAVSWYLSQDAELTDRQRLHLQEAVIDALRGRYSLAMEVIWELNADESEWSSPVRPEMVEGITHATLRRLLSALIASDTVPLPTFR